MKPLPSSCRLWSPVLSAGLLALVLLVVLAGPAEATWSIVAADEETGEVGAAMASCGAAAALGQAEEVLAPIVLVPGQGVGVLQASVDPADIEQMRLHVSADGSSGQQIVESLVADDDETLRSVRQYGVVVLSAPFDGVGSYSGDLVESGTTARGSHSAAVQGVLVAGPEVVNQTLLAFEEARDDGQPLDRALVAGLLAGAQAGGDAACGQQHALFAQLAVASPTDTDGRTPATLLTVTVDDGDGQDPVALLATAFERGDRGWVDAGLRSPTLIPKALVLALGLSLALAAVMVIGKGMRMG